MNNHQVISLVSTMLVVIVVSIISPLKSQPVTIMTELSSTELFAGDEVSITFSTTGNSDVYFFSVETSFNPEIFEFLEIQTAGLAEDGYAIADYLSSAVIGASVTRTAALSEAGEGEIMTLTFKVRDKAPAGLGTFSFTSHALADSEGGTIDTDAPEAAEFEVEESISFLQLTTPATIDVTEGDEFFATGKVYANGVTIDDEYSDRIRMWVGVTSDNTDPETWEENNWQLMEFTEQDSDDYFNYNGEIAFQRETGVYYVALRTDLDNDGDYRYGGINGYWDETDSQSAVMEIFQQPPFRYTIAAWDFDDERLNASRGVPVNRPVEIELFGASLSGFGAGHAGRAANSNNWDEFEEETNYWQVVISTEYFESLRISSKQYGSGTGPRNFQLQASVDGLNWEDVSGGTIEVEDNWTSGVMDQLQLPENLNNQPEVYIRWLQTDSMRIDTDASSEVVAAGGTNRIDDIIITGINPDAGRVNVWPGDTNNDGVVDELDVMPLGQHWLTEGPLPIYQSFKWEAREVEEWIPKEGTHADAAGTGRVDHNDLQVIGLNYGKSRNGSGGGASKQIASSLAQLELEPMLMGETAEIYLVAEGGTELSGVSFRMDLAGLSSYDWSVESIEPLTWGESWAEDNRLIEFQTFDNETLAVAMVHKGYVKPVQATNLLRIKIRAEKSWGQPVTARLLRAVVSSEYDTMPLQAANLSKEVGVSVGPPVDERPQHTELLPNYPNPFNPVTTIPYTLSETGDVQIRIFDAIGRQVTLISQDTVQPGSHAIDFDASALSSGIYFYQLYTNGIVQTRRMTLVK